MANPGRASTSRIARRAGSGRFESLAQARRDLRALARMVPVVTARRRNSPRMIAPMTRLRTLVLAWCVAVTGCVTNKRIDTAIEIDAPPSEVYAVLADFENYPRWNPYHIRVVGVPEEGAELEVRVSRPDGKVVDVPHVEVFEARPGEALVWGGGIRWIFRGEHRFDLTPTASGGTRLAHTEEFTGWFIRLCRSAGAGVDRGLRAHEQGAQGVDGEGSLSLACSWHRLMGGVTPVPCARGCRRRCCPAGRCRWCRRGSRAASPARRWGPRRG